MVKIANTSSCVDHKLPYIKVGDTVNIPIYWVDADTGEGIEIDSTITVECTLLTSYGVEFLPDVIIASDQIADKGKFTIHLPDSLTLTMKPCIITTDFKISVNGQVKHSDDFTFEVRRSITP